MAGWVKLYRVLTSSAIAAKPEYLSVWVHLLLSASHKQTEILVGRQVVKLEPGQLVFGRVKFSAKTGVSEATIRSALKAFETLQQITIKSESKYSIISITNWARYQQEEPAKNQKRTSSEPAVNHIQEVQELQEEDQQHLKLASAGERDEEANGRKVSAPIPYDAIFDAYSRILPTLPQLRFRDDARRKAIKARWNSHARCRNLEFWVEYFEYIRDTPFLMSMNAAGFDWFLKPANFKKVIEGNYQNARSV